MLFNKKVLPVEPYISKNDNFISDTKDGSIYKEFKRLQDSNNTFSFSINTDGISLCEKFNEEFIWLRSFSSIGRV